MGAFIALSGLRDSVQERAPLRAKSKAKALFIPCTVEAKPLFISSPTRRKSVLQNSHDSRKIGAKKCRRLNKPVSEYRSRIGHTARTLRGQVMTQTARINADLQI